MAVSGAWKSLQMTPSTNIDQSTNCLTYLTVVAPEAHTVIALRCILLEELTPAERLKVGVD
jgi:hypothetical protein